MVEQPIQQDLHTILMLRTNFNIFVCIIYIFCTRVSENLTSQVLKKTSLVLNNHF
jgi:hypothetical protein